MAISLESAKAIAENHGFAISGDMGVMREYGKIFTESADIIEAAANE